ncbi:MAG: 50S ribosomal protein L4 [Polyangiaceae bacterium]|nr:50S ribosomal protein L4 [Polyangiaceae bacterium]
MAKLDVYNLKREKVGEVELSDEVFSTEVKEYLLHEVVQAQLASRRAGTKAGKERSAVAASKKKLYKQKGTGQARHGQISAPTFVGGGRAHPPKPQDFSYRPPRKVRLGAMRSALSYLLKQGRITVVENIDLGEVKTKRLLNVLSELKTSGKTLVVDGKENANLRLSIRNMQDNQFLPPEGVNVYDLLCHEHLVVSRQAAKALEARLLEVKS